MTLAFPAGLWLLTLLPVVVAAHLFFHEKRSIFVASLMFWDSGDPREQHRFRLRAVLSMNLLLQVAAVTTLAAALSQPELAGATTSSRDVVICIDTSASTLARHDDGTRFDTIRAAASRFAADHRESARVVVAFSGKPRVVGSFAPGDGGAEEAIAAIAPDHGGTDLGAALAFAEALLPSVDGTVHIFTDGSDGVDPGVIDNDRHVVHVVGARSDGVTDNVAIVAADVSPGSGGAPTRFFARIENLGSAQYEGELIVEADGNELIRRPLIVEAEASQTILLEVPVATFEGASFLLTGEDLLNVDNVAYVSASRIAPTSIVLVTRGNPFLESALSALPGATVTVRTLYTPAIDADIVVLDRRDGTAVPYGRILAVDSRLPGIHDPARLERADGESLLASDTHPVAEGVETSAAFFADLWTVEPAPGRRPIFTSGSRLAAFSLDRDDLRVVSLNFDVTRTNLVLSDAFPRLLFNAADWLLEGIERPWTVRTGDTVPSSTGGYVDTRYTGFAPADDGLLAVNLFDPSESDIRPAMAAGAGDTIERSAPPRCLWPWLAATAALLLVIDTLLWSRSR